MFKLCVDLLVVRGAHSGGFDSVCPSQAQHAKKQYADSAAVFVRWRAAGLVSSPPGIAGLGVFCAGTWRRARGTSITWMCELLLVEQWLPVML